MAVTSRQVGVDGAGNGWITGPFVDAVELIEVVLLERRRVDVISGCRFTTPHGFNPDRLSAFQVGSWPAGSVRARPWRLDRGEE
jgi:hypothetical protein